MNKRLSHRASRPSARGAPQLATRGIRYPLRVLLAALAAGFGLYSLPALATDVCVPFEKQVSLDGGITWFDADDPLSAPRQSPGGDSEYRFIFNNCEERKVCFDTRVRDETLGILDSGNSNGVLVADIINPGEQVIVTKDTPGFENLDQPGQCIPENTATETTTVEGGGPETFSDPAFVDCGPPDIDIEKATNGFDADDPNDNEAPEIGPGDPVTWSYLVTNIGNVDLENVSVSDDQIGMITCPQTTLAVGESIMCSAMGTAEDLLDTTFRTVPGTCGSVPNRPLYANMGTATGSSVDTGEIVMDDDPSHYCNPEDPAIQIEKATNGVDADDADAGDAPQIAAGDPVTWSYVVTNIGTVPLVNVLAFDETLGVTLDCEKTTLAPGESMNCNPIGDFAVELEFGDANVVPGTCGGIPDRPMYENVSKATGVSEAGTFVEDRDPSHYCNTPPPPPCGLTVVKGCAILPPPPPPVDQCDGKLQQFTMIWDGGDGTSINGPGFSGTLNNGDEATFVGPFSSNDVLVNIGGLGTSKFHVSCSDDDMDGDTESNADQQQVSSFGRDCGKFQGDGKGSTGVNQWLLEGFIDNSGEVLDCTVPTGGPIVQSCEFFAEPVSCETVGKPSVITMRYIDGACPGNNTQGGKTSCSGNVEDSLPVTVTLDGGTLGPIDPGATFDVPTTGSNTVIELSNSGGMQTNEVHTSCSAPLVAGETFGNMELVALDGQGLGADVVYSYLISNSGNLPITGITAFDDKLGPVPGSPLAQLNPGDSTTLNAAAFVTETVTNTVTVNGNVSTGAVCVAESSSTVTAMGPPPCDISIVLDKIEDKKIKWKLTNNSSSRPATIESLTVSWPGSESLKKIKFDGSDVLKDDLRDAPSTTVVEGDWLKEVKDRRLDVGDSGKKLEIEFTGKFPLKKKQSASDFTLTVTFAEGCSVNFNP